MNFKESVANNATINKVVTTTWKNAPTIAFIAGAAGSVVGLYFMWKAARKHDDTVAEVIDIIEEVHEMKEPDDDGNVVDDKTYTKALVKAYIQAGFKLGKLYAPVAVTEIASIALMSLGYGKLNSRYVNTLAACSIVEREYARYRQKVIDALGDDADKEFRLGVKKREVEVPILDDDGNPKLDKNGKPKTKKIQEEYLDDPTLEGYSPYAVPFDKEHSKRFDGDAETGMATSWYNREFLIRAQDYFNMLLNYRLTHIVFLNEVLDYLGYEPTQEGQVVGWRLDKNNPTGDNKIIFVPDELYDESYRAKSIILDFNVDGNVWKYLDNRIKRGA